PFLSLGDGMKLENNGVKLRLWMIFMLIALLSSVALFPIVGRVWSAQASRHGIESFLGGQVTREPVFDLSDLSRSKRFHLVSIDPATGKLEVADYHYGVVKGAKRSLRVNGLANEPPEVSKLSVALKGKNKANASFEVM